MTTTTEFTAQTRSRIVRRQAGEDIPSVDGILDWTDEQIADRYAQMCDRAAARGIVDAQYRSGHLRLSDDELEGYLDRVAEADAVASERLAAQHALRSRRAQNGAVSHRVNAARTEAQVRDAHSRMAALDAASAAADSRRMADADARIAARQAAVIPAARSARPSTAPCTDIPDDDHGEGLISTSVGGSESDSACGSY